jgi:hypothetical protein
MRENPCATGVPALIVFGEDKRGRAHASAFAEEQRAEAIKAAELMGMLVLPASEGAAYELALELPAGRIFASGRGFVPFVDLPTYRNLRKLHAAATRPELESAGPRRPRLRHRR